jgi:lathosterol oxidase
MLEMFSPYSYLNACIMLVGYVAQNTLLQYWYYCLRREEVSDWKIQPESNRNRRGVLWFLTCLSNNPGRGLYHRLLTTLNLSLAVVFVFFVSESCINGRSKMSFAPVSEYGLLQIFTDLIIAYIYENIAEYYWHRLLHIGPLYRSFHKVHHYYKAPEPFDDMMMHPLEALCYYCILYSPPFLCTFHVYSFVAYMTLMGLTGTLDHSGIKMTIYGIYDTRDHDKHHSHFNVNFGFPHPFLDILHGTYDGCFMGKIITPRKSKTP